MAWTWDFMLLAFNALGGRSENVARKSDKGGRGLVPIDPQKPVRLHAPENLLFPVSDAEFADGRLRIKDSSSIGTAERSFFENYYESISWGAGGRAEALAFRKAVADLPAEVRTLLSNSFGMDVYAGNDTEQAEQWFVQSRLLVRQGRRILVPVLDLVNHGPKSNPPAETTGVTVGGSFADEVVALRARLSPFGAFWRFGAPCAERTAFSLPAAFRTDSGFELTIAQNVNLNSELSGVPVPDYEIDGRNVRFSCLLIGHSGYPKLARGIFYRIMKDAGEDRPEQVFDNILHQNRLMYLNLLAKLEPFEGPMISTLRKVVRYQLEAMSWCVGSRDL